jgi:hypothetical protein
MSIDSFEVCVFLDHWLLYFARSLDATIFVGSQNAMEFLHLMYNLSKAWDEALGRRLDGDRILAAMSDTAHNVIQTGLRNPQLLLQLDGFVMPPRRTLDQLRSEGYVVKPAKDEPFSDEELATIQQALQS